MGVHRARPRCNAVKPFPLDSLLCPDFRKRIHEDEVRGSVGGHAFG